VYYCSAASPIQYAVYVTLYFRVDNVYLCVIVHSGGGKKGVGHNKSEGVRCLVDLVVGVNSLLGFGGEWYVEAHACKKLCLRQNILKILLCWR
jgi:hypothetical protein